MQSYSTYHCHGYAMVLEYHVENKVVKKIVVKEVERKFPVYSMHVYVKAGRYRVVRITNGGYGPEKCIEYLKRLYPSAEIVVEF